MRAFTKTLRDACGALAMFGAVAGAGCSGGGGTLVPGQGTQSQLSQSSSTTLGGSTSGSYAGAVLANAPFAYYPMNDLSGTTMVDASGHQHDGHYAGSISLGQGPIVPSDPSGRSVGFANGYASENATWSKHAVTAECWVVPTANDLSSSPRIVGNAWSGQSGNGFAMGLSGGKAAFQAGLDLVTAATPMLAGKAYHLVGTFSVGSGTTLYVNGVAVGNTMPGNGPVPSPQIGDSTTTYIGAFKTSVGIADGFQGTVSNCALYDHALTAAQVAAHFATGATTAGSPTPTGSPTLSPAPPASAASYTSTVLASTPLAFYRLAEAGGNVAADSSGFARSATYNGNVLLNQPPLLASDPATSASFASGYVAESTTWTKQAVSAECWIKPTASDVASVPRILDNAWSDHSGNGFMLWISGGKAAFQAGYDLVDAGTPLVAGQTYHLVGTFDTAAGTMLYVNGVSVGTTLPGTGPVPNPQIGDGTTSYIGVLKADIGLTDYFQGDISDCAIYDHALSASEIAAHYKAALQPASFTNASSTTPTSAPTTAAATAPTTAPTPTPTSATTPTPTSTPAATPTSAASTAPTTASNLTYNATNACINHTLYANNVLPAGVGEFQTNGLNRTYWGGTKTRTVGVNAGTWGPGFLTSWGRHQYDTYWADPSDGLGIDPFYVGPDTAAPGSPTALRIMAEPTPANVARSLTLLANDQWPVTTATAPFAVPAEGGTLVVNVANPGSAQNGWNVGMGYQGGAVTFVGTLTSGGNAPSTNGGASNPWTITNIHIYSGATGATVQPTDEGGLRAYQFPDYVSGVLDANVNQEYGFFVSRLRLPNYLPAVSPAFWTLETGGVLNGPTGLQRNELDIEEMFANTSGNALNQNEILWNTNAPAGVGVTNFANGTPQSDYHDYGVLVTPTGTSFYVDGKPTSGDVNLPDWTQGSPDKELMLMFQVGAPGSWLDGARQGQSNPWPLYLWSQWIRAYAPTSTPC